MKPIDTSALGGFSPRVTVAGAVQVKAGQPARAVDARNGDVAKEPLSAGTTAPVDAQRVRDIRKAIEDGRYPVVPTRIADAMIAAGILLRTGS